MDSQLEPFYALILSLRTDFENHLSDFLNLRLLALKLTHKMAPIENPLRITSMRKVIARLNTELTKRSNQA